MKTLIIFDIDGTLLYSNKIDSQCFSDSYEAVFDYAFPSIDWQDYPHVTDHTIFGTVFKKQFNRRVTEEELDRFQTDYVERMEQRRVKTPEEFKEVPGARQTVENLLKDDRYAVGIATGGWQRPGQFKLRHIGIDYTDIFDSYADYKETRDDIVNESIENAKKQHSDLQRIVYVGDALWDVKTTRNMGLPLIGIRRNGDHHVLANEGATHILQDYSDYGAFMEMVESAEVPKVKN
ncbi:MAG: HAD superfamily hydrolase (TIGR01549 family) [Saprospiraceae bacterium]|jgi:HAD superfamily hydrolase (TIGR01549 family)